MSNINFFVFAIQIIFFMILIFSSFLALRKILNLFQFEFSSESASHKLGLLIIPSVSLLSFQLTLLAATKQLNLMGIMIIIAFNFIFARKSFSQLGEIFPISNLANMRSIVTIVFFFGVLCVHFSLMFLPDKNVDVAVFHYPLVKSILDNDGFTFPQIPHPFYGSIPLGSHLLAASMSIFELNSLSLHFINFFIFWCFIALVISIFSRSGYLFSFIFVSILFFSSGYFVFPSTDGMQDVLRSCTTLAAILLFDRFLHFQKVLYLFLSGLTAGLTISLKMSELLVGFWIIVIIVISKKTRLIVENFRLVLTNFLLPLFFVGSYFYLRNFVETGNPIYPFLFAHPGLSDAWMENYYEVLAKPGNPELLQYSRDPSSYISYFDFVSAYARFFLSSKLLILVNGLAIVGFYIQKSLRPLIYLNVGMFVFWYLFMFNDTRWALSGHLLTMILASVTVSKVIKIFVCYILQLNNTDFRKAIIAIAVFPTFLQITPVSKMDISSQINSIKVYIRDTFLQRQPSSLVDVGNNYRLFRFVAEKNISKVYYQNLMSPNEFLFLYTNQEERVFMPLPSSFEVLNSSFYFMGNLNELSRSQSDQLRKNWSTHELLFNEITKVSLFEIKGSQ
jgi:hypothetical protein